MGWLGKSRVWAKKISTFTSTYFEMTNIIVPLYYNKLFLIMVKLGIIFDQSASFSEKKRMSEGNRAFRRDSGKVILPYLLNDNADPRCDNPRIKRQSSSKSEILEKPISETLIGLLIICLDPIRFRVLGVQYNIKWFYYFVDEIVRYYIKHQRLGGDNLAYQVRLVRWLLLSYVNVAIVHGYYAMVRKAKKEHPDLFVHSNKARYYYWDRCPLDYHKLEDEQNINNPTYKAHECNRKRSEDIKRVVYDSMDSIRKCDLKDFVSSKSNGVSISFKEKVQNKVRKKGFGNVSIKTIERAIKSYLDERGVTFSEFVDGVRKLDRKIKEVKSAFGKVKRIKIFGIKVYDDVSGDEIVDEFGMAALSDDVWIPDNSTPFLDDYIELRHLSNNFNL